jgi:hypothetical protein
MTTPDLPPIPPATLRVSVVWADASRDTVTLDIPTPEITGRLRALEDHVGAALTYPRTRKAAYAAAAALRSADDGNARIVTAAGLWIYINHPDIEHANAAQLLSDALAQGGSALLLAMVSRSVGKWTFRLHAMPRWPGVVKPTEPEAKRRQR